MIATRTWMRCGALLALTGCAAARQDFIALNAGTAFSPRPTHAPVVLTVGDLDRPYQEIGVVHVSGISRIGYAGLNERMRAKARQVGADAIIFVTYGTENVLSVIPFFVALPYDVLTAQGLAVRSQPPGAQHAEEAPPGAPPATGRMAASSP